MKRLVILGSTGSIGRQTIEIVKRNPDKFNVIGLSANRNVNELAKQAQELKPKAVALVDKEAAGRVRSQLSKDIELFKGQDSLPQLATHPDAELVVNALVGSAGLDSTLAALESKKTLALANKESMVAGGDLVINMLKNVKTQIIPVDSEHSAIFQCLLGEKIGEVSRIILTSSGGPFRGRKMDDLKKVTAEEALAHPRWNMGKKISIDSATLMNKGLEVIEAHFLFGIDYEEIEVVIHPQSIIHSMVEFLDGSIKAHLAPTDMRIPIQYALSYPERFDSPLPYLDFKEAEKFTFEEPDMDNFPCLRYSIEAGKQGKTYPAVLNAANEEAVAAFLNEKIPFTAIPEIISEVLDVHSSSDVTTVDVVKEAESWARNITNEKVRVYGD